MKIQNRWSDHHLNIMSAFLSNRTEQRRILGALRFSEAVSLLLGFLHFHSRVHDVVWLLECMKRWYDARTSLPIFTYHIVDLELGSFK